MPILKLFLDKHGLNMSYKMHIHELWEVLKSIQQEPLNKSWFWLLVSYFIVNQ